MHRILLIHIILLAGIFRLAAQTPGETYTRAGELYGSGDYSGAAAMYRQLWEEGYRSGDLLYNAGNAFFKSGDNASAILFYERAKLLAPADEDIDYNLQIARSRITDRFETVPELFFVRWFDFLSLLASTNTWAVSAFVMFLAALLLALVFLTKARARGRLLSFWLAIVSLILAILMVSLAVRNNSLINNNRKAVIRCSIVTGRSAPGETGNELFVLHSGTTVTVEQELGNYREVRLPDGNKGWIGSSCMEKI
ncbi:competence protein [bacterium]|nr:competence protein [bacterium]